jgi:hypothetical protein
MCIPARSSSSPLLILYVITGYAVILTFPMVCEETSLRNESRVISSFGSSWPAGNVIYRFPSSKSCGDNRHNPSHVNKPKSLENNAYQGWHRCSSSLRELLSSQRKACLICKFSWPFRLVWQNVPDRSGLVYLSVQHWLLRTILLYSDFRETEDPASNRPRSYRFDATCPL